MNVLMKLVPTSFLIGAVAGPLAMFLFQYIKKLGGWIDAQPTWAKQAWLFVLTQIMALVATVAQADVSCTMQMTATDCLAQLTPSLIKGLIVQGGAIAAFKLKKMPSV
jgi:hypothetical protein